MNCLVFLAFYDVVLLDVLNDNLLNCFPLYASISVCIPANFFWVKSVRFFSQRMPGFPKTTRPCPKISEDVRSISKHVRSISEDVSNVSGSSPRTCFAEHDLVPNAFLVKTLRFRRKYRHLLILHGAFVSCIG